MSLSAPAKAVEKVFTIAFDREEDGRWIAEIPELSGVLAYGATKEEAEARVQALALHVVADETEENLSVKSSVRFAVA